MRATFPALSLVLGLGLLSLVMLPTAASAGGRGGATLYLSLKDPSRAANDRALLSFAKQNAKRQLPEVDAPKYEDRYYMVWLVAKFDQLPKDSEVHLLFYDLTDGARKYFHERTAFIDKRHQTQVIKLKLDREQFPPNRKIELVMTMLRQEVGSLKFDTTGKPKQHSGVVDFGDGS